MLGYQTGEKMVGRISAHEGGWMKALNRLTPEEARVIVDKGTRATIHG
jgi:hypothetical protein